jgi:hypothetical protein
MSGTLLPSATKASPTVDYYLKNGDSAYFSTVNAQNINASTISLVGDINTAIGASILNQSFLTFSGGAAIDAYTMGIQNISSTVIPYGTATLDRSVLQVSAYGDGDAPAGVLTGSLYLNPLGTNIPLNTECAQITADASGNVFVKGLTVDVSGEIIANNGITNSGASITSVGQNIIATEGSVVASIDGECRSKIGSVNNQLALLEMTGNITSGAVYNVAVGGDTPVAPYQANTFGIYAGPNAGPFVEALTVDVNALVKVAGAPVAKPSKVAYVGLVGTDITVAAGQASAQVISANFAVKAGHTYRVSVQCSIANGDPSTAQTNFTALYASTSPGTSVQQVSLGAVQNTQTVSAGDRAWSCVFVAVSDSAACKVECFNSSATNASVLTLNAVNVANAPSVLVEDLGIL